MNKRLVQQFLARVALAGSVWLAMRATPVIAADGERKLTDAHTQVVAEGAAWGTITPLADGSLGLIYQLGRPLPDVDACNVSMQWVRSADGGKTWSAPVLISERLGPNGTLFAPREGGGYVVFQQRNQALGQLPGGRIVCSFCELNYNYDQGGKPVNNPDADHNHQNQGVVYTWSDDMGKTWLPTRRMDTGPVGGSGGGVSPHWRVVTLKDGTALMTIYGSYNPQYSGPVKVPSGTRKVAGVVRSTDSGKTWGDFTPIFTDSDYRQYEETALCLVGEKLLAHQRRSEGNIVQYESLDGGRTWHGPTPLTEPGQHPGGAFVLASGKLLATWGNRRPPFGAAAMIGADAGETWNYEHRVSLAWDAPGENCGYANGAQAGDGTIVVTYYIMPAGLSAGRYRTFWTDSKVYATRFTEEQFLKAAGL